MFRVAGLAVGDGIAIDVRRRRQGAGLVRVFGCDDGRARSGGRIVDRDDLDCHRIGIAAALAIAHRVGKAVSAVEVGNRCIGISPVGVDLHRAVRRVAGFAVGDGISSHIGGCRQIAGLDRIFVQRDGRADGDPHRIRVRPTIAIADGVSKAVGTVIIG